MKADWLIVEMPSKVKVRLLKKTENKQTTNPNGISQSQHPCKSRTPITDHKVPVKLKKKHLSRSGERRQQARHSVCYCKRVSSYLMVRSARG